MPSAWDGAVPIYQAHPSRKFLVAARVAEPGGTVTATPAQLAMQIEGIDWRTPNARQSRLSRNGSGIRGLLHERPQVHHLAGI
jgi:hypothetical protein